MVGLAPPPAAGRVLRVESVEGLATLLVALLTIMALAGVAVAAVLLDRVAVLGDPDATSSAVIDVARRGARAKRLYELGVLATGVVWIRWQVHYVRNVQALGRPTGFEPGWAIGGWLIPGVNLVIPPRQLAVSAASSDPSDSPSTPKVLYAWWAALVATGLLFAVGRLSRPPEHEFARSRFGDFQVADRLHAACMAAGVVAAVLGILTVFVCTKRQEQLLATAGTTRSLRLGMADFPPPPPPGGYPPQPPQPGGWAPPPPPAGGFPPQPTWQAPPAPGAFGAPPAYATAGYGYGYGAPPAMKALGGLATALTVLLAIMVLIELGAAAAFFDRASLLDDANASFVDISDADDRVAGAGGIHILGVIATGIVWVIWQFRFVKNVQALGRPTGFSPGFAIGGWIIPIANWFIPEQQLAVSARSSDPAPGGNPSTPGVLYGWWATWVGSTLLFAAARVTRPADDELFSATTLEDFQTADRMQGLGLAVGAVAAILAILTVRTCTKRQQQLIAQLPSGTGGGQPAYPQPAYPPYQQPAPPYQQPPAPQPPPYQPPPPPYQPPPTTF